MLTILISMLFTIFILTYISSKYIHKQNYKTYWIDVLRGINRVLHWDRYWDFKREDWSLRK